MKSREKNVHGLTRNKQKCIIEMFRKGNRLVTFPELLVFFDEHVIHCLLTKPTSEILVNKMYKGLFLRCQNYDLLFTAMSKS